MNLNAIRTILTGLAGIIPLVVTFFGCTTLATGGLDCSASWVPPKYALILSGVLGILSVVIKAFGQGGTVSENLVKPSVVVTPETKPGTVTPAQVGSH